MPFMPARRDRSLKPAFVVVAAVAVAACGQGVDSLNPQPLPGRNPNSPDGPCDPPEGCVNPPPPPRAIQVSPKFGTTVTQTDAPPSLGAATLVVSSDGAKAIASDPDRDRVVIVDLAKKTIAK